MGSVIKGRCVIPGVSEGEVLATSQPIGFFGGIDPQTGRVIDPHHELFQRSVSGKVLVCPFGKGSSGTAPVILELVRNERAPAAIINLRTDPILAAGPIIGKHIYGKEIPIITVDEESFELLRTGQHVLVNASEGKVVIQT
jgi:predicted aconitase with swiveling domain